VAKAPPYKYNLPGQQRKEDTQEAKKTIAFSQKTQAAATQS